MTKKIQSKEELFIQFSDEELEELKMEKGQKFSVEINDDNSIKLTPFTTLELEISDFSRELLEFLIAESCEKDISVNEIISNLLKKMIEDNK